MLKSHKKLFWCIAILTLSFLFPGYSFAQITFDRVSGSLILGIMIIPFSNFTKWIILDLKKPYTYSKPIGKILFWVAIYEIFLVILSALIIGFILDIFNFDQSFRNGLTELQLALSAIILYGVLSILPNVYLVKERDQKLKETFSEPNKIIYSTILAFIMPAFVIFLMIIGLI